VTSAPSKLQQGISRQAAWEIAVTALVLVVASAMVWPHLFSGWIPADDGGMAQSAERVLRGELPHRDFQDPWTGGWSFMQAAIFRIFGTTLAMLRIPIFVAWLSGLIIALRVARRFVDLPLAGLLVLGSATWSLYAWHLPLLNWYYAPLAMAACWGVFRFEETGRHRWLVLAGAAVGGAILVKVTGVFVLAALLLWCLARAGDGAREGIRDRRQGFAVVAAFLLAFFLAAVVLLLRGLPREMYGVAGLHFLLPCAGISAWVLLRVQRGGRGTVDGLSALLALLVPLFAGALLVAAPFLLHYVRLQALDDLLAGVLIRPRARLTLVAYGAPGRLGTLAALIPPLLLFAGSRRAAWGDTRRNIMVAAVLGACWGAAAHFALPMAGATVALSIRAMPIVLPLLALWWDGEPVLDGAVARMTLLLVGLAATSQLVQVPYADFAYFLFVAPLAILATIALVASRGGAARGVLVFWGAFLVVAGAWRPLSVEIMPPRDRWAAVPFRRAGLLTSVLDSARLQRLGALMQSRPAGPIYVTGDAPELPFLLERASSGGVIYEVLADSADRDPSRVLRQLDHDHVLTVIIKRNARPKEGADPRPVDALRREFPQAALLWPYEVRWRMSATAADAPH
jgi:hypothetical protein